MTMASAATVWLRGVSVQTLLDAEVTSKVGLVTEQGIESFYQANKAQLKGDGASSCTRTSRSTSFIPPRGGVMRQLGAARDTAFCRYCTVKLVLPVAVTPLTLPTARSP